MVLSILNNDAQNEIMQEENVECANSNTLTTVGGPHELFTSGSWHPKAALHEILEDVSVTPVLLE